MASYHTGCNEQVLVSVEHRLFAFYIKGKEVPQPLLRTQQDTIQAVYALQCRDAVSVQIGTHSEEGIAQMLCYQKPLFFEQQNYEIVIERLADVEIAFDHDHKRMREAVRYVGKRQSVLTGIINFRNDVGRTDLRVLVEGALYLTLTIEVFPSKMDYAKDYQQLVADINESVYNLSYAFLRTTYHTAQTAHQKKPSLVEFYRLLKEQEETLCKALQVIIYRPHHTLKQTAAVGHPKPKHLRAQQAVQYLMKHPQYLEKQGSYYIPQKALNVTKQVSYDTPENQWVAHWLHTLLGKLSTLKKAYNQLEYQKDEVWLEWLEHLERKLQFIARQTPFHQVSRPQGTLYLSTVFQMAPGYKHVYKSYHILMRSLNMLDGLYKMATKNIAELYEYWCFIKVGMLLKEHYELVTQDVVKVNQTGLFVTLQKGRESTITYKHPVTKETFKLAYNPHLTKLPTVSQKPDTMLELTKEIQGITYRYVLDAKYKVQVDANGLYLRPKDEDINTMHRYRDAIVSTYDEQRYEKTVFGAIVLFPGCNTEAYEADVYYQSIEKVGIGGLPFLPGQTQYVEALLEKLMDVPGHQHHKQAILQQGTATYLQDLEIEKRNVLIGPTRGCEQVEKMREHLLYHIPLKAIRHTFMQFEYIAPYVAQYGTTQQGGIYEVGKVKAVRIQKRKALLKYFPTTSSNLEEEYVVFELESLELLKKPIRGKAYGVRHRMYTNDRLLQYAETLADLSIRTYKELEVYLQIKRLIRECESSEEGAEHRIHIGETQLRVVGDDLECTTKDVVERVEVTHFLRNPRKYLAQYDRS